MGERATVGEIGLCAEQGEPVRMVQFDPGGRLMADFTDVDRGAVEVGMDMRMVFRVKERDAQRGFVRYFWKAAPAGTPTQPKSEA